MASLKQLEEKAQRAVEKFNSEVPIGAEVVFWPVIMEGRRAPGRRTKTRTTASVMSCSPVVWCEGIRGCVGTEFLTRREDLAEGETNFDPQFAHLWE